MKKLIITFLLLATCASGAFSMQTTVDWLRYDSAEGRYSVLLPAKPKLQSQEATSSTSEKFQQYLASAAEGDNLYMIGYFDILPNNTYSFEKARDGMLTNVKGTLLKETAMSLGGYSGMEYEVAASASGNDYVIRVRNYQIEKRIYFVQFIHPQSLAQDVVRANAAKYFDSFRVVTK